jgi:hypothetical protein
VVHVHRRGLEGQYRCVWVIGDRCRKAGGDCGACAKQRHEARGAIPGSAAGGTHLDPDAAGAGSDKALHGDTVHTRGEVLWKVDDFGGSDAIGFASIENELGELHGALGVSNEGKGISNPVPVDVAYEG